jgi:Na+/melibiose symporter-like transporter
MAVPMALSAVLTFTTLRFEGAARTVDGIRLLMSLVPAVGAVMAVVVLWFCRLDEATALRMGRAPTLRRGDAAV